MNPLIVITFFAVGISFLVQLINKIMVNEEEVEKLRNRMKEIQKKLKTLDHKSKEYGDLQEEILDINFKIMKQQMKPTFVTLLPYLFIFYFLSHAYGYLPLEPGSTISFSISGEGHVAIPCLGINQTINGKYDGDAEIQALNCTSNLNGEEVQFTLKNDILEINKNNINVKITPKKRAILKLPFELPFIGDNLGWLGTFILISFISSLIFGRTLKKVKFYGKGSKIKE